MSIVIRSNEPAQAPAPSSSEGVKETVAGSGEHPSAPVETTEQKEAEASEASDAGTKEETDGETEPTEEPEAEKENDAEAAPKKKGGFQRRIDKLNAAKAAAQQEAEYWKREALKSATAPKGEAPKADPKPEAGKPTPEIFDTHAAYVEALTDWKVEQAQKTREAREQTTREQAEQKQKAQVYAERARAYAATKPDFAEVLSEVDGIALSPAVQDIILSSDNGPELAYELARNPDAFERVCKLPPMAAAREMGRIEARLSSSQPKETKPEPKKITNAPKPLEPVKAGKGSATQSIFDSNLSQAEYERLRREQLSKRRQG